MAVESLPMSLAFTPMHLPHLHLPVNTAMLQSSVNVQNISTSEHPFDILQGTTSTSQQYQWFKDLFYSQGLLVQTTVFTCLQL